MDYDKQPNDMVDASAVDTVNLAKKDQLLERIHKRNKERQNNLDVKLEQRNKENLIVEGEQYFSESFSQRLLELEDRLCAATQLAERSPGNSELARHFADIALGVQELQRYISASTFFLTDFKVQACQNVLNDFKLRCENTRTKVLPRKKFNFSARKVQAIKTPLVKSLGKTELELQEEQQKSNASVMNWTLANRQHEYILLKAEEVDGKDITVSQLAHCFVEIQGIAGNLQISNTKNCTFLSGPIMRSVFAEHCSDCTFAVACQQLRLHHSFACTIYLHVTCRAIIEDCKDIQLAPYNYKYDRLEEDFLKAGFTNSQNNYTDVADFNWLSPDRPSPNWSLLKLENANVDWLKLRQEFEKSCKALPL